MATLEPVETEQAPGFTLAAEDAPAFNLQPAPQETVGWILPMMRDDKGELHPAIPKIVSHVVEAFKSGFTLPGDVLAGSATPDDTRRVLDTATLGLSPSAAMGTGRAIARGALGPAETITGEIAPVAVAPNAIGAAEKAIAETVPKAEEFAGNINLSRIFAPEDVKAAISQTATDNAEFLAARRGVISHEETASMADLLGMSVDDLAQRKIGQAFNAEEMFAARNLLVTQASKVQDAARRAVGGSDVDRAQFAQEITRLATIQEQVSGATAEAGRTLSQFRMMAGATREQIAGIVEASKTTGIDELAAKIADLDDPAKVGNFAANAFKAKTADYLLEAWVNALLSGPTTHATNILSNSLVSLWSIPESVASVALSKVTGSGMSAREPVGRVFGILEGALEGIPAAWRAFRTEIPSDAATKLDVRKFQAIPSIDTGISTPKLFEGTAAEIGGKVEIGGKQIRIPGRLLQAEDEFFKAIGYRQEINAQAYRRATSEGLSGAGLSARVSDLRANPSDAMKAAAHESAAKQTFTNPLGGAGQALVAMTRELPVLRIVMPFIRTPVNIVKYAAERSPAAPLFSEVRANLSGANGGIERDGQIARIALGSTVAAAATYLASQGSITGGGPAEPAKRALMRADGWQPYSVRVGNEYYSYSRLDPLGMLLGVAADFAELNHAMTKEEKANIAGLVMGSVSKNLISKTWMQGPADLIQAIHDPQRYGGGYTQKLVGTLVPTGIAQVAQADDPFLREARTVLDTLKSRIPGQRESLMVKRDVFGEPVKKEGSLGSDLFSPIYMSMARNDPAIKEMLRLDVAPGVLPRKFRGVELSPQEYDAYSNSAGHLTKAGMDTLTNLPQWGNTPDPTKKELMEEMMRKAHDLARVNLLTQYPDVALRVVRDMAKKRGLAFTPAQ